MAMAIGVHVPSHGAQMPNARSSTTPVTGRDGRAITRSPAAPPATTANTISRRDGSADIGRDAHGHKFHHIHRAQRDRPTADR